MNRKSASNPTPKSTTWKPPTPSVYKLNVDGALFFDTHKAGIGFSVHNHAGKMALAACIYEKYVDNPVVIESLAVI